MIVDPCSFERLRKGQKRVKCLFGRLYSWVKLVSVWVVLGKRSPKNKLTPKSCFLRRLFLFVWAKRAKVDMVQLSEWGSEGVSEWVQGGLATAICQEWPEKCNEKETTEVLGSFVNTLLQKKSWDYRLQKKSRQFDLVKLVGVRGEDAERRPPAQMVPISKCITTQTKYIRSEISHKNTKILTQIQTKYIRSEISLTNTRKYLNKCKKYPLTNTDQVLSVGNISHKYRQSIFGQIFHKYK